MLDASLGHIEIAVQIRLHGVIEMFLGKVLEPRRVNLKCRVVYEHIEPAKFTQRLSNNLVAKEDGAPCGNSGTAFSFKLN